MSVPSLKQSVQLPQTWWSPVPLEYAGVPFRACFSHEGEMSPIAVLLRIEGKKEKERARAEMVNFLIR